MKTRWIAQETPRIRVGATFAWLGSMVFLGSLIVPGAQAQTAKRPEAYSLTEVNALMGPAMTMKIDRDGAHVLVEATMPLKPGVAATASSHIRTYYELENHKSYTWSLADSTAACTRGDFSGDWGDPFEVNASLMKELAPQHPRQTGEERVNGFVAKVLETAAGPDQTKVWLDTTSGLVVKVNSGASTVLEVKHLSLAKPPAILFAVPAKCSAGPPTQAERIGAATGSNGDDFVDAIRAQSSPNTCPVVFRVVHAGTMTPITSGFQLAIDRTADDNSVSRYSFGSTADGHMTFSGGGLREVTGQLQNGAKHFPGPPAQFYLAVGFGTGGWGGALIHRQCFGSPSTLLLVVKNPKKMTDGADWLWVKSGKVSPGN